MNQDTVIYGVLADHLQTLEGVPDIVFPNESSPGNTPRLEVSFVPVQPERLGYGTLRRHYGLFQVTVVTDSGIGLGQSTALVDAVSEHYPLDLNINGVKITEFPEIVPGMQDGAEWRVPVTINYQFLG